MVNCPVCGQEVDWVTLNQAAQILGVSGVRVSQFIKQGRLPGANKHKPSQGVNSLWKIPIVSLLALHNSRQMERGLEVNVSN
jgi:hypothetical protein